MSQVRALPRQPLGNGVIGNTTGFGPVVQGSSPCSPAMSYIKTILALCTMAMSISVLTVVVMAWLDKHRKNWYYD